MLGFSKKEEALMRNATGNGVAEAIPSLQHLFRTIAHSLGVSVLRPGVLKEAFGSCIKSLLQNIAFKEHCSCGWMLDKASSDPIAPLNTLSFINIC